MISPIPNHALMQKLPIQVPHTHYDSSYDDLPRFLSYYHQIHLVQELHGQNILEVGIGNGFVSTYLRRQGMALTTCDFDASLQPDIVADIRSLPLSDSQFEVVTAFEVLEHLPWDEVPLALAELSRVSSRYVLISLPYAALTVGMSLRFSLIQRLFRRPFLDILLRIPLFTSKIRFNGEHYWEMGKAGFSRAKIRQILSRDFTILRESRPLLHSYHYFFVLEKKKALIG